MTSEADHILITGAAGFIGQELITALLLSSSSIHLTATDITAPPIPPQALSHASRVTSLQTDLTSSEAVASLLTSHSRFNAIYLLHGIMSGGAEANLELGLAVNLDSHRVILDALRQEASPHRGSVVVFPSSLAVYGPAAPGQINTETTCPVPQSSYGAQKLIIETLLGDYSRRGLLDGRIVRLPTIIVRPGAPSAAASSFASGIVRESLKGEENILPVGPELPMWVCSPKTVVKNLVDVKSIPHEKFGISRVLNLPGVTVTVADILNALEVVGGTEARKLVREERSPQIEAIVGSWPAYFDVSKALGLGLSQDGDLITTVKDFAERLRAGV
ncbi:NAD-dependent epimerase/dehydratase [Colletotrichum scovillei]|uniref:NAD-dependent epimerase/dehydratase n=1 Tax=Colletotrichum scovillei TaxID=1209932 RepID=UPI0015C35810|nr:NAD-dependent epimerase/dehydratase [Colletotrichum scovillei]KAF4783262.1 NAD-dependent epimerase/dehydratase [Colletotrichum scovillei]